MSHTPGPWNAIKDDTFNPDRPWGVSRYLSLETCQEIDGEDATYPSRTEVIAEVMAGTTAESDAKLIAAAPDLLEACRNALDTFANLADADDITEADHETWNDCLAAIAKAEGDQ